MAQETPDERALRIERERNEEINRRNAERAAQIEKEREEEAWQAQERRRAERRRNEQDGGPTSRHPFRP